MKSSLALIALFSASTALACPNLAGKYSCRNEQGGQDPVTVTQSTQNNVTTYVVDEAGDVATFIADGVERTERHNLDDQAPEFGTYVQKTTVTCAAEVVKVNMTAQSESKFVDFSVLATMDVKVTPENKLQVDYRNETTQNGQKEVESGSDVCTRVQ